MTKILLLGKSGMLGSCFDSALNGVANLELHAFSHEELDVCDFQNLGVKFEEIGPDLVINCTAYTAVDEAEKNRDLAFRMNAEAVEEMAKLCEKFGAILIHFSTDYVFDGKMAEGYTESDQTGPINVYGESKLAGEELLAEKLKKFYLIRTSWLFGKNGHVQAGQGKNFVDTMLKLGREALKNGAELKIVSDQIGSPTYADDLVRSVVANFIEPMKTGNLRAFGIYHLTNSGTCSRYEFAKQIFLIKKMPVAVKSASSTEFPRPAKRPACSTLLNNKIDSLRSWKEALAAYLR